MINFKNFILFSFLFCYGSYNVASQPVRNNVEISKTDSSLAIKNWKNALVESRQNRNDSLTLEIIFEWSQYHFMKEDFDEFFELTQPYIEGVYKGYNSNVTAYLEILFMCVEVHRLNMDYDSAIEMIYKRLDICEKHNYTTIGSYLSLSEIHIQAKKYEKGIEFNTEALRLIENEFENLSPGNKVYWKAYASGNFANAYYELENYKESTKWYDEFNRLMKLENKDLKFRTSHYLQAFNADDIKVDFEKLEQLYEETQNAVYMSRQGKNHVAFTLAEKYQQEGMPLKAISYWQAGLGIGHNTVEDIYPSKKLFETYLKLGQQDSALKYNALHNRLLEKSYEETSLKNMNELNVKYETAQKDAEISEKKVQFNRLLGGFGFVLLISAFFLLRYYSKQRIAQQEISLLKKDQKLLAIDYMVQGQEEERKRIAQDLHDGLGGLLTSARLQMQNIQREIDKISQLNLINKAEELVGNAYAEVRRISHDMMPGALVDLGLFAAIEDLVDEMNEQSNIKVTTQWFTKDSGIIDKKKVVIYRIVQEALNNSLKHSQASHIHVEMTQNKNAYNLTIEDDGIGFDYEALKQKSKGIGLQSLQSRVDYLNGEIQFQTAVGKGTQIDILIPLE